LLLSPAFAVEHPGTLHESDNCSSCHIPKTTGKSVHSAMSLSCTVCHLAQTRGDMTTLSLLMPKEKICSACHDSSAELRKHTVKVKGFCLECHDAHSSEHRLLLREEAELPPSQIRGK
jgi:predicted CXXCH cytochrome family protein